MGTIKICFKKNRVKIIKISTKYSLNGCYGQDRGVVDPFRDRHAVRSESCEGVCVAEGVVGAHCGMESSWVLAGERYHSDDADDELSRTKNIVV